MTAVAEEVFYDSRVTGRGCGFPTTNTEIALLPPNVRDPQGYYAEIGVPPWATMREIRFRVRQLYRTYHPDTGLEPDVAKFNRIHRIAEVLLNPESREKYNNTPPGCRLLDAVYEAELSKLDELLGMTEEEINAVLRPPQRPVWLMEGQRYDYLSLGRRPGDWMLANQWYLMLLDQAHDHGYYRVLKVLLHDERSPAWSEATSVIMVPRHWEPCRLLTNILLKIMTEKPCVADHSV